MGNNEKIEILERRLNSLVNAVMTYIEKTDIGGLDAKIEKIEETMIAEIMRLNGEVSNLQNEVTRLKALTHKQRIENKPFEIDIEI